MERVYEEEVYITYKNYKGEVSNRLIRPGEIYFGSNEWHPKPQWLMRAFDIAKNANRDFAIIDIQGWAPARHAIPIREKQGGS